MSEVSKLSLYKLNKRIIIKLAYQSVRGKEFCIIINVIQNNHSIYIVYRDTFKGMKLTSFKVRNHA